jgi:hypothetical protein
MLLRDEPVELCMGHVVNEKIPNCSRARVVQRKDIDGFYGRNFETEFVTLAQSRDKTLAEVILDPQLRKKVKPRILVENAEWEYHHYQGGLVPPHQTQFEFDLGNGRVVRLVVHKRPAEVQAALNMKWEFVVESDCRLAALVSLIKAAHLTLFRILGYRFALSACGLSVGRDILGQFFLKNSDKDPDAVMRAAKSFFQPYVNMLRPIERVEGAPPRGTVEDRLVKACFGSRGAPFGILVCVRTNTTLHTVLIPAFATDEAAVIYWDFLKGDNERLVVYDRVYDGDADCWHRSDQPSEVRWPKRSVTFQLGGGELNPNLNLGT